jgi:two-component system sensor histidine kinase YesM
MNKKGLLYYIEKYRYNSVFFKSFVIALIISILLCGMFSVYIYRNVRHIIESEMHYMNMESLVRIKNTVDSTINTMDRLAIIVSMQPEARSIVLSTTKDQKHEAEMFKYLKNEKLIYQFIESIYVYSQVNDLILSCDSKNNSQSIKISEFEDLNWLESYENTAGTDTLVINREKYDSYLDLLTLIRPISFDGQTRVGAVVLNLNIMELNNVISNDLESIAMQEILLLSDDGIIVCSTDRNLIFENINDYPNLNNIANLEGNFKGRVRLGDDYALASVVKSRYNNWKYVSFVSSLYYADQMRFVVKNIIIVCSVLFLLVLVVSIWIASRTYKPIKNILAFIDGLEQFDSQTTSRGTTKNEVELINSMVLNSITKSGLRGSDFERQFIANNRAQLLALSSQMKSHFLYNTLATIQWKAIDLTGEENEVSTMIYKLGELFKMSIDIKQAIVKLSDEVRNAKLYTDLLETRYDNFFTVKWDIDDTVLDYKIINICYQPLLENAVYHGIKPSGRKGRVKASAYKKGNMLYLTVEDNGVGIEKNKLNEIMENLKNYNENLNANHVGLWNIQARVKLMFGEESGINIQSEINVGTKVEVFVPIRV